MKSNKTESEFKVLSDIQHILQRPAMYIGQTVPTKREMWMFDEESGKFQFKEVEYTAGLDKILNEIIDNTLDVAIESNFKKIHTVSVKIDSKSFTCTDDGPGIPVKILDSDDKKRSCVELAWTQPRAGTSFNEDRRGPSANGIGSTASNIFSKVFKGTSDDGKLQQKIVCKDNLSKIKAGEFQPSSGQSGVSVYLEPDLERFGLTEITQTHIDLIHQRLINLSILFPELKFKFNGKTIRMTRKQFASAFSDNFAIAQSDNSFIVIFRNEYDEFKFFSYVNGLNAMRGGTQIDYCINEVTSRIRNKLVKKFKTIRPGDVKNKLGIVVFMSNVANLQFDAQTKESISNSQSDIKKYFDAEQIDFDKLAKDVLKNDAIIEQIVETFKLKEEVKNRIALKHSANAKVKIDASKYISQIGEQKKFLAICEGFSAMCGLSAALGRKGIAYYAGRGVPLNIWDCKSSEMLKNKEFIDIVKILGIDPTKHNLDIEFDTIVQANDADVDGLRIQGLYFGWWLKLCPEIFNKKKVARLMTPYIILWADAKMTKIHKAFYTLDEFKAYEKTHDISKYKKNLYKGLGSWSKEQFQKLFESSPGGINDFLQYILLDENGKLYVDNWLNSKTSDKRKEYLRDYTSSIELA